VTTRQKRKGKVVSKIKITNFFFPSFLPSGKVETSKIGNNKGRHGTEQGRRGSESRGGHRAIFGGRGSPVGTPSRSIIRIIGVKDLTNDDPGGRMRIRVILVVFVVTVLVALVVFVLIVLVVLVVLVLVVLIVLIVLVLIVLVIFISIVLVVLVIIILVIVRILRGGTIGRGNCLGGNIDRARGTAGRLGLGRGATRGGAAARRT